MVPLAANYDRKLGIVCGVAGLELSEGLLDLRQFFTNNGVELALRDHQPNHYFQGYAELTSDTPSR